MSALTARSFPPALTDSESCAHFWIVTLLSEEALNYRPDHLSRGRVIEERESRQDLRIRRIESYVHLRGADRDRRRHD